MAKKHDPFPISLQLKTSLGAMSVLYRKLGTVRMAKVTAAISLAQARGEPFKTLAPPEDERERLSRKQAGPAILLYKALREVVGPEEALELSREVVIDGAVRFLGHSVGPLDRETMAGLDDAQREKLIRSMGERFFNATLRWDEISVERIRFTVTRCRFPELCRVAGVPEVAPLLCAGDAVYFGEVVGTVEMQRQDTIAGGAECCDFELTWKDD